MVEDVQWESVNRVWMQVNEPNTCKDKIVCEAGLQVLKGETQRRDWKSDSPFVALVFKQTADKFGKHPFDTAQSGGLAHALIPAP